MRRRELVLAGGTAMAGLALGARRAHAKTTIAWWHAMGGANGERVNKICADFNASQSDFEVKPAYKGSYAETMTAAIAAFRAKQQPHILQVFEVGTATMMAAKGAIYPVYELMKDTGQAFDPDAFLPAVKSYYTTPDGQMLSMPFNSSTPVLWYNKDAFEKAGLDPEKPPTTWPEMEEAGKKLVAAGSKSGFTTTWPSWIHIENFSAWHNLPVGTEDNGFGGLGTRFEFNKTQAVMHTGKLAEWQKAKIFDYGGRTGSASPKFFSADAAMMTEFVGRPRGCQEQRQVQVRHRLFAVLAEHRGRAAEHHHRRRLAVDPAGAPQGRVQGRGGLLLLSLIAQGAGLVASGDRLPADHHGRLRAQQGAGLLREEPGCRHLDQADDPAPADRQLEGHALRQHGADPGRHQRGAGARLLRAGDRPGGPGRGREARQRDPRAVPKAA